MVKEQLRQFEMLEANLDEGRMNGRNCVLKVLPEE